MKYFFITLLLLVLLVSCGKTEPTIQEENKGSGNIDQQRKTKTGTGSRVKNITGTNSGDEFFIETKNINDFNSITTMEKSEKLLLMKILN